MRMGPLRQDRRKIGVGSKQRSGIPGRPFFHSGSANGARTSMRRRRKSWKVKCVATPGGAAAAKARRRLRTAARRPSPATSQKRCMLCFGRVRVSLDRRRVERALDELHGDLGRRRDSEQQHRGRQPRPRPWRSASAGRMSRRGSACPPEPRPRAARTSRPATGGRSVPPRNAAGGNDRNDNRLDAGATRRPRAPTQCLGSVRQPPPGTAKRRGGPSW